MAFGLKLCFVVVVAFLLQEGQSLKCYQCPTSRHGECDNVQDTTKVTVQTCTGTHNACLVLTITENDVSEVRRECADSNYCEQSSRRKRQAFGFGRRCRTCDGNLCNSASNLVPFLGIGIAGLVLIKYYL